MTAPTPDSLPSILPGLDREESVRLDIWLWRARFFKTRALAGAFIDKGRVRLVQGADVRRLTKRHYGVRCGDVLSFAIGARLVNISVVGLGTRRGPPAEARALYAPLLGGETEGQIKDA